MNNLDISKAVYMRETDGSVLGVIILLNGETNIYKNNNKIFVPADSNNRHYAELLKQVQMQNLQIAEVDEQL